MSVQMLNMGLAPFHLTITAKPMTTIQQCEFRALSFDSRNPVIIFEQFLHVILRKMNLIFWTEHKYLLPMVSLHFCRGSIREGYAYKPRIETYELKNRNSEFRKLPISNSLMSASVKSTQFLRAFHDLKSSGLLLSIALSMHLFTSKRRQIKLQTAECHHTMIVPQIHCAETYEPVCCHSKRNPAILIKALHELRNGCDPISTFFGFGLCTDVYDRAATERTPRLVLFVLVYDRAVSPSRVDASCEVVRAIRLTMHVYRSRSSVAMRIRGG